MDPPKTNFHPSPQHSFFDSILCIETIKWTYEGVPDHGRREQLIGNLKGERRYGMMKEAVQGKVDKEIYKSSTRTYQLAEHLMLILLHCCKNGFCCRNVYWIQTILHAFWFIDTKELKSKIVTKHYRMVI